MLRSLVLILGVGSLSAAMFGPTNVRMRFESFPPYWQVRKQRWTIRVGPGETDEGHGWARPANDKDWIGRVEEFLARHLGGRAQPWESVDGTSAEVR